MKSHPDCVFLGASATFRDWETLAARGIDLSWVSIRDLVERMHIRFLADEACVDFNGEIDVFANLPIVWYNPGSFEMLEDEITEIAEADNPTSFEARQFRAVLKYLEFWLLDNCHLVQLPQVQRRLANKLIQLQMIAKAFPDSIIETELISTPDKLTPGILVKHLGESRGMGNGEAFYAQKINSAQLSALSGGGPWVPILAQHPMSATEEFRTFTFGQESATIRIPRPCSLDGIHDIQFFPDYIARAHPVSSVVADGFWGSLGASIGLSTYAADYAMQGSTPRIFEINPVFSWAWLPDICIDAIARAARAYFTNYAPLSG